MRMLLRIGIYIALITLSLLPVNAQESFVQFNAGYGLVKNLRFGGTIGVEVKLPSHKTFTYSLQFNYYDIKGSATINNPNSSSTSYFKVSPRYLSFMLNWYPIKSPKQPYSLIYLGIGSTYFDFSFNDVVWSGGPGIRTYVGFQYLFFEKLALGLNFDLIIYYETIHPDRGYDIIFDGGRLNLTVGYRINQGL